MSLERDEVDLCCVLLVGTVFEVLIVGWVEGADY